MQNSVKGDKWWWKVTWDGEHTKQYTDDVLQNCTLETYIINQHYPKKFNDILKNQLKMRQISLIQHPDSSASFSFVNPIP